MARNIIREAPGKAMACEGRRGEQRQLLVASITRDSATLQPRVPGDGASCDIVVYRHRHTAMMVGFVSRSPQFEAMCGAVSVPCQARHHCGVFPADEPPDSPLSPQPLYPNNDHAASRLSHSHLQLTGNTTTSEWYLEAEGRWLLSRRFTPVSYFDKQRQS